MNAIHPALIRLFPIFSALFYGVLQRRTRWRASLGRCPYSFSSHKTSPLGEYVALTQSIHREHADMSDTLPEDIGDSDRYVPIPHKTDLGLGKPFALEFTAEYLLRQLDLLREIFSQLGAYACFKDLLVEQEILNTWHSCEQDSCDSAHRQWCADHEIALQD